MRGIPVFMPPFPGEVVLNAKQSAPEGNAACGAETGRYW